MSQGDTLLAALRDGPKSLNQVLAIPGCAAEYRRAFSDLRDEGYGIVHHKVRNCKGCPVPGLVDCPASVRQENVYRLEGWPARTLPSGQQVLAFA